MVRIRSNHAPTINYIERRTTDGLTKREIIRCLKRYVAREIYNDIRATITTTKTQSPLDPKRRISSGVARHGTFVCRHASPMTSHTSTLTNVAGASGISRSALNVASAARAFSAVSKSQNEC